MQYSGWVGGGGIYLPANRIRALVLAEIVRIIQRHRQQACVIFTFELETLRRFPCFVVFDFVTMCQIQKLRKPQTPSQLPSGQAGQPCALPQRRLPSSERAFAVERSCKQVHRGRRQGRLRRLRPSAKRQGGSTSDLAFEYTTRHYTKTVAFWCLLRCCNSSGIWRRPSR